MLLTASLSMTVVNGPTVRETNTRRVTSPKVKFTNSQIQIYAHQIGSDFIKMAVKRKSVQSGAKGKRPRVTTIASATVTSPDTKPNRVGGPFDDSKRPTEVECRVYPYFSTPPSSPDNVLTYNSKIP